MPEDRALQRRTFVGLLGVAAATSAVALGLTRLALGDVAQAETWLRQATRVQPESAEAWSNQGIHPKRGAISVLSVVEILAGHCESHARTIGELRQRFSAGTA